MSVHGRFCTTSPDQCSQPSNEFCERERLDEVVVATGCKSGQPVRKSVARGEEDHRCPDALCSKCLDDIAPIGVWEPDVDHQRLVSDRSPQELVRGRCCGHPKSLLTQCAREKGPQLGIIFEEDDVWVYHRSDSIALV